MMDKSGGGSTMVEHLRHYLKVEGSNQASGADTGWKKMGQKEEIKMTLLHPIFGRHDTEHKDTQHNVSKHKYLQHNEVHHNNTQHNDKLKHDTKHNDTQNSGRGLLCWVSLTYAESRM